LPIFPHYEDCGPNPAISEKSVCFHTAGTPLRWRRLKRGKDLANQDGRVQGGVTSTSFVPLDCIQHGPSDQVKMTKGAIRPSGWIVPSWDEFSRSAASYIYYR
jgi:hypothetical protein